MLFFWLMFSGSWTERRGEIEGQLLGDGGMHLLGMCNPAGVEMVGLRTTSSIRRMRSGLLASISSFLSITKLARLLAI